MDEFCLCGGSVAMRTLYRTRYNIPVGGGLGGRRCRVALWVLSPEFFT